MGLLAFALQTLLGAAECRAQGCQPYWTQLPPFSDAVAAMLVPDPSLTGGHSMLTVSKHGNSNVGWGDPVQVWNGTRFVPLGPGLIAEGLRLWELRADGGLPALYLTVRRPPNLGPPAEYIWNGSLWKNAPPGMLQLSTLGNYAVSFPKFSTNLSGIAGLYGHLMPDNDQGEYIVRWSGWAWKFVGRFESHTGALIHPMIDYAEGNANYLVVSGDFEEISGIPAHAMARWDGQHWSAIGIPPSTPYALTVYDDGTGPSLYMGFDGFTSADSLQREGIARWNGTSWVSVGGGTNRTDIGYGGVRAMAVFDDGSGPALFVTGAFNRAGGISALQVAKWDGHAWSPLGAGLSGFPQQMAVVNDGRGESLFIQGDIPFVGGGVGSDIVQWVGCRGQCYANCDNSTASPRLNVNDFMCFLNAYVQHEPYANCNVDAEINVADFQCFMTKFAAGCP